MALRETMSAIVKELRTYGAAAYDDVYNGETYWTDAQLQDIADKNSRLQTVKLEQADVNGTMYKLAVPRNMMFEDSLVAYNDREVAVATPFTFNSLTGELTFEESLTGDSYLVYGRGVDIYDALAELWQIKADQRFNYIDWKAQNNKMNMAQEYQHCVDRALFYRQKRIRSFQRNGRGRWPK